MHGTLGLRLYRNTRRRVHSQIAVGNGITHLLDSSFASCSNLQSVSIGSKVTYIGDAVFANCSKLESIVIPLGVTEIRNSFLNCTALHLYCEAPSEPLSWHSQWCYYIKNVSWGYNNITTDSDYDYVIRDGKAHLTKYKGTETDVIVPEAIDGYEIISISYAFGNNTTVERISVHDGVKKIVAYAFGTCEKLKQVILRGATEIGAYAFYSCPSLESIVIPRSLEVLDFYGVVQECPLFAAVFYEGTSSEWESIEGLTSPMNSLLTDATLFLYSSEAPEDEEGNYWCFDEDGIVRIWYTITFG